MTAANSTAFSGGTYAGGWRIIRTLGKGLVEIRSPPGMAAESASAAVILTSSHLGFALSTTQVVTGSIVGTGIGKPGGEVRWGIAGRMVVAWMITLRAEGAVGALMWWIGDVLREYAGPLVVVALLVVISSFLYARSRLQRPRNKPAMRSVYTSRRSPTPCPAQKTSPASSPA